MPAGVGVEDMAQNPQVLPASLWLLAVLGCPWYSTVALGAMGLLPASRPKGVHLWEEGGFRNTFSSCSRSDWFFLPRVLGLGTHSTGGQPCPSTEDVCHRMRQ